MEQDLIPGSIRIFYYGPEIQDLDHLYFIHAAFFGHEHDGVDLGEHLIDSVLIGTEDLHNTFSGVGVFVTPASPTPASSRRRCTRSG